MLQETLKQHLSASQNGPQYLESTGSSLPELANCITTEYLESAQLRYTLPVFLSETCNTRQSSRGLTSQSVLKQLGISEASSFGRAFTSYTPSHPSVSGQGESLLATASTPASLPEIDRQWACSLDGRRLLQRCALRSISLYAGEVDSLLSGLLRAIELLHGNAGEKERHQTMQVTS